MEASQQMNVRIPTQLKQSGDAVLARFGSTPSEGVRRFYEYLVRNQQDAKKISAVMETTEKADAAERERARRLEAARSLPKTIAARCASLGIRPSDGPTSAERAARDEEAYLDALVERYEERGLL